MDNPLTKQDLTKIKDSLYKLNEALPFLDLMDRIGIDTTDQREKIAFLQNAFTQMRTTLFPTQP